MKKMLLFLVMFGFAFSFFGCQTTAVEKEFTGSGITITLNDDFTAKENVSIPLYLESFDTIFMGFREAMTSTAEYEIYTLNQYIQAVLENNSRPEAQIYTYDQDGVFYLYAYYSTTVDDINYGYMLVCMAGEQYFYTMHFYCLDKNLDSFKDQYIEWANTITVD
jgi:hypothetical protein